LSQIYGNFQVFGGGRFVLLGFSAAVRRWQFISLAAVISL
jgi:hypothetical protein